MGCSVFRPPCFLHPLPPPHGQILSKSLISGGDTCPPRNDGRPSARVSEITECLVGCENICHDSFCTWTRFRVGELQVCSYLLWINTSCHLNITLTPSAIVALLQDNYCIQPHKEGLSLWCISLYVFVTQPFVKR